MTTPRLRTAATRLAAAISLCLALSGAAATPPSTRAITGSVRLPDAGGATIGRARIVRTVLTPAELASPVSFSVSLRMRDLAGLQARVSAGETLSQAELEASYLPARADFERVAAFLKAQGFALPLEDRMHTTVFARGSVDAVARAFGVSFARVAVSDGEYTSAVSEPQMPADLGPAVLSVNDLQPEFRLRHADPAAKVVPLDVIGGGIFVTPDNVLSAYNVPATATGAGQTVAIVGEAGYLTTDIVSFWQTTGVAQSASRVTAINVDGSTLGGPMTIESIEATLDIEWIGAMAPSCSIRLYEAQQILQTFTAIQNDLPAYPGMRVISVSYGNTEGAYGASSLQALAQLAATLASQGVTIVASSGDAGSNPNNSIAAGQYLASAPLGVSYPASDPSVTGVGGSTITFTGNWDYSGETAWGQITGPTPPGPSASGGGTSGVFKKPSWQTGGSLLAGQAMRCVPDVAGIANAVLQNINLGSGTTPQTYAGVGVLIVAEGTIPFTVLNVGGTSLSCPVWAGVATLINEARANAGVGPIGLLNPHLYPLAGTSALHDVNGGTNGAYSAVVGYDLCSGLGSPNVAKLIAALGGVSVGHHRLVNVSVRAQVQTGANIVIAGFVVGGSSGTKDVLVRGVGPALAALNVSGSLANPVVGVYDQPGSLIASNTGWGTSVQAGTSKVAATYRLATAADMSAVGAFSLASGSADSAMVLSLPAGNYTMQVSGAGQTSGVALSEVYELSTASALPLKNLSARCFVGTGSQVAICGFVVEGNEPAQLLVRGVGPGLSAFNVSGPLAQPSVAVYDANSTVVASNTGWGTSVQAGASSVGATYRLATQADMAAAGAFSLAAGSADSAMVITLPPGTYTAIVSGANSSTGVALAEVYDLATN